MLKIVAIIAISTVLSVHCQSHRDDRPPTRYVLPYSGLDSLEDPDEPKEEQPQLRRAERIPATSYQQFDDIPEEEYYRPQPRTESYQHSSAPSHKDYEQILKATHLARLRAAAKKQTQPQPQPQPQPQTHPQQGPVEQYLKEVSPTTPTTYQRPANYLRFKQDQEEARTPKPTFRYVLQPEPQPRAYQYQYEAPEPVKPAPPKTAPFNLVAYQNALLAQQKVLAEADGLDDSTPKSSIYVSQNIAKKQKIKQKLPSTRTNVQQYDYYQSQQQQQQQQRRPYIQDQTPTSRFQQSTNSRALYQKGEVSYQVDDYSEGKEPEQYQPAPARQLKPKSRTAARKPVKYQPEPPKYQQEQAEDDFQLPEKESTKYQQQEELNYEYQTPVKYQPESVKYQPDPVKYQQEPVKYEPEPVPVKYQQEEQRVTYRRPASRQQSKYKYQQPVEEPQTDVKSDYLYQPKYQPEPVSRRAQYQHEPVPSRYLARQQYQEETQQLPQYVDLAYQPSSDVPVRYSIAGRGPIVAYTQELDSSNVRYFKNLARPLGYVE